MKNKETSFSDLTVGDIFHADGAEGPHGVPSAICMVTKITSDEIEAVRITTHEQFIFHRKSGVSICDEQYVPFVIDSIAELPLNFQCGVFALYEKLKPGRDLEDYKLTSEEIQLLLYLGEFYKLNPMPGPT